MDKTQIKLELQIAREWARQGNTERVILHIDLAEYYLLEKDKRRPCQHLNRVHGNQNSYCADCGFFPLPNR